MTRFVEICLEEHWEKSLTLNLRKEINHFQSKLHSSFFYRNYLGGHNDVVDIFLLFRLHHLSEMCVSNALSKVEFSIISIHALC